MIEEKIKNLLSFTGFAIIIGVVGSLSSILTLFITEWDAKISLKWFVFTVFLSLIIIVVLIRVCADLNSELKRVMPNRIKVLRYIGENSIFLVEKNSMLGYSAMVSIFYLDDSYEVELGKGYVLNIQEEFIQIKLITMEDDFTQRFSGELVRMSNNDANLLSKIVVKSYIKYSE